MFVCHFSSNPLLWFPEAVLFAPPCVFWPCLTSHSHVGTVSLVVLVAGLLQGSRLATVAGLCPGCTPFV